jgi:peptidyl-tRNA hydrolase, PTH1 family
MKYLIVGLGNVGEKYDKTRHNIGFDVLDKIADAKGIKFEIQKSAFVCETSHKGKKMILVKPTTFMNLSGKAVKYYMQEHNISLQNVLILVDDLALPVAKLRLKPKGSDAGHNGLKNINEILGTQNYARLKFGIGDQFPKGQQADFVLSKFSTNERIDIELAIDKAVEMVYSFVFAGIENTMNQYN